MYIYNIKIHGRVVSNFLPTDLDQTQLPTKLRTLGGNCRTRIFLDYRQSDYIRANFPRFQFQFRGIFRTSLNPQKAIVGRML